MTVTVEAFDSVDPAADAAASELLARPMAGAVRLALTRDPSPMLSSELRGQTPRLILARDRQGPAGMAMSWRRPVFLAGREAEIGYLGQLRLARPAGRGPLKRGFALALDVAERVQVVLTTIGRDNHRARRLLEHGPGLPAYRQIGEIVTLAFSTRSRYTGHVRPAESGDQTAIADLLARQRSQFALAPRWTARGLSPAGLCRDLQPGDFMVAEAEGSVEGCCAVWDQRGFKQVVVRGYRPVLRVLRPILSALHRGAGLPTLPAPGSSLRLAFLSHFFADRPRGAVDLVRAACKFAKARGLDWLSLSLSAQDPLLVPLSRLRHRRYRTVLYSVGWHDEALNRELAAGFRLEGALL